MNDVNKYATSQPQYTWTEERPLPPRLTREEVWFQTRLKTNRLEKADTVLEEFDKRFNK